MNNNVGKNKMEKLQDLNFFYQNDLTFLPLVRMKLTVDLKIYIFSLNTISLSIVYKIKPFCI